MCTSRMFLSFTLTMLFCVPSIAQQTARLVAPGVISKGHDYCTTITADGKTLYFARQDPSGHDRIMVSKLVDGTWQTPEVVHFSGVFSDTDPLLNPSDDRLYFMSNRNATQDGWKEDYDIWVSDWKDGDWQAPYRLPDFINTSFTEGFPCVTNQGNLYFFRANKPGHSEQDIWQAETIGGGFDTPRKVRGEINTAGWDGHPFVNATEDYMIFYSTQEDGYGSCDLYISYKMEDTWGTPENLGPLVNTAGCEMVPFVSRDEKTLYFTRRDQDGKRNIFQISFEELLKSIQVPTER